MYKLDGVETIMKNPHLPLPVWGETRTQDAWELMLTQPETIERLELRLPIKKHTSWKVLRKGPKHPRGWKQRGSVGVRSICLEMYVDMYSKLQVIK